MGFNLILIIMPSELKTITLKIFGGLATVNCYLIKTDRGFILIDTGISKNRAEIEKVLQNAGCGSGDLKLIVITHGDSDHTGNCAYLRDKHGSKIAMHQGDLGMVQRGDMLWNRKGNLISRIISPLMGLGKSDRFIPDFYVDDGYDLSEYGWEAKVVHIPGHSAGSIGILTSEGDFFCGDLFTNTKKPQIGGIIDDEMVAQASVEKLKKMDIKKVYPGHGDVFSWKMLFKEEN